MTPMANRIDVTLEYTVKAVDLRVELARIPAAVRQRDDLGHDQGDETFGRTHLGPGIGKRQPVRRVAVEDAADDHRLYLGAHLFQEPLAEDAPALDVQTRLSDQDLAQLKMAVPVRSGAVEQRGNERGRDAGRVPRSAVTRVLAACQSSRMPSEASSSVRQSRTRSRVGMADARSVPQDGCRRGAAAAHDGMAQRLHEASAPLRRGAE